MIDPDDGQSQRWLIRAKFEPPKQDVRLVTRSFLFDRLDACLPKRLGLVLAPAGFGKSSLLAQWSKHRKMHGAKTGWLSLDEADSEPLQFISYAILALHQAGLELDRSYRWPRKVSWMARCLPRFLASLRQSPVLSRKQSSSSTTITVSVHLPSTLP